MSGAAQLGELLYCDYLESAMVGNAAGGISELAPVHARLKKHKLEANLNLTTFPDVSSLEPCVANVTHIDASKLAFREAEFRDEIAEVRVHASCKPPLNF